LQTEVALSTTEAEFIALSDGLRSKIQLIVLVTEFREKGMPMQLCMPKIVCWLNDRNISHTPNTSTLSTGNSWNM